ncbi:AAA family ATPase [Micromonospora sp. DT31]|uniref:helix-turn-helix transcriptional regulator n=1 Tax=Micromonospora sp. DT31 TaxID=3393434 RepID=UPI003CECC500
MTLIEREKQMLLLDRLAQRAFAGQGQIALVTGPPATGRTALLQAYADTAAAGGALTLVAAGAPFESTVGCGVLGQLVHGTMPEPYSERITVLLQEAWNRGDTETEPGRDPQLLQLFQQICLLLRKLAADRPLLIGVDDIGHADPASLAFLQQLARRLRSARILMILADTESSGSRSPFRAEVERHLHLHHVDLGPLSRQGVRQLLHERVGPERADRLTAEFHEATGGNPLLLSALVDELDDPTGAPRFGRALLDCLHGHGPVMLSIARATAVLGDSSERSALLSLVDAEPNAVEAALSVMTAAGVMHAGTFRHGAARTAVLEQIPAEEGADLHRRAAQLFYDNGAPARTVAQHLLSAGPVLPSWATAVLVEAAEQAIAEGHCDDAAAYLESALRADAEPARTGGIRARLMQIEWEISPSLAARHLPKLLDALRREELDRRDALLLCRQLLWLGHVEEAAEALNLVRDDAYDDPQGRTELRDLDQWLAYAHPPLARHRHTVLTGNEIEGALVTPTVDPWLHATAAITTQLARGRAAEAADRADLTLRDLELGRRTGWSEEATVAALAALAQADLSQQGLRWAGRLRQRGDRKAGQTLAAILSAAQAGFAVGLGDLSGAVEHARAALTELTLKAWGVAVGLPLSYLILAQSRLGHLDEAGARVAQAVPEAMLQTRYGIHYLYARGHYHLAIRHHHAALADFIACGELVRDWGLDALALVQWRAGAAEAWLRLGNEDQSRRLMSDELTGPASSGARSRGLALRILAELGPVNRRPQLLTESLELLESCGDRYEQARTLADLASTYHALGQNRRARVVFRRALHLALVCESDPLYRQLLSIGDELGESKPAPQDNDRLDELTDSERRVASLAAMGYTNREIARKLYITASTVEQHLTRVYRKLKVPHRRELPTDLTWHDGSIARIRPAGAGNQPRKTARGARSVAS